MEGRMDMERNVIWKSKHFFDYSLRTKLILSVMFIMAVSLGINLVLFSRINTTAKSMEQVYATNIRLGELEGLLTDMESDVYQYLNIQSQEALEHVMVNRERFEAMILEIDDTITDHPARRMERSIRRLAVSYLELADRAIEAKQAHDAASYREDFQEVQAIYTYLLAYIRGLDTLRFKANSENYDVLYQYLCYLELFITAVLVGVTCCLTVILYVIMGNFTRPLEELAVKAKEVGKGNFGISLKKPESRDEVGTVTEAFNQMIVSLGDYIRRTKEGMELEIKMKERELVMENLLKDAQLKYYQAQINPHFLFNTLNAGQQLAMMEDAERTYMFMEHVALFFRYRLKNGEESTLGDEVGLVDSYMYIMNVRYSNEIHLEKRIDPSLLGIRFPGMVLQPVIENALHHGLGDVEWEKRIWFLAAREGGEAVISVRDNGAGMAREALEELNSRIRNPAAADGKDSGPGNGVGLVNVRERLRLSFDRDDVLAVESQGEGKGTLVVIRVPVLEG